MADIHIARTHALPLKKAREAADKFADQLAEKFDLESEWHGDTLHFKRAGVNGTCTRPVDDDEGGWGEGRTTG